MESINKDSVVFVLDTFFNELHVLLYQNNGKNPELKIIAKNEKLIPKEENSSF